jgi:hypothetical protein
MGLGKTLQTVSYLRQLYDCHQVAVQLQSPCIPANFSSCVGQMTAKNMRVLVGVTPRATPTPSPVETPRSARTDSTEPSQSFFSTVIGEAKLPKSVAPMKLPFEIDCMSLEDQEKLTAVLQERDRNFMAAKQLLMDHAMAARDAETLANANGDKLTPQEAELIAKKHDEMVEVIMHELNTMEVGYEKILQDLQAKEMMCQLKTSLETKCCELRERLAVQKEPGAEPPLLRDLQEVLDKQNKENKEPPSTCGSSETHTPRSEQQTPRSVHCMQDEEGQTPRMKNRYLITSNELSDHDSGASSLASTPRQSSQADDDEASLRMMKQLKASLDKKRSKMQQDLSTKNDATCSERSTLSAAAPDHKQQASKDHRFSQEDHQQKIISSDHEQKLTLQQGLRDIDFELEQLARELGVFDKACVGAHSASPCGGPASCDTVQVTASQDMFFDAPVKPKEILIRN